MTDDKNPGRKMTLEVFIRLLETHGPEPLRWPSASRAGAMRLLKSSQAAQAASREAAVLGELLDQAPAGEVHAGLTARILASAPGAGPSRAANENILGKVVGWLAAFVWPPLGWARMGWLRPAAFLTASLGLGFYVGLSAANPFEAYDDGDLFAYVFELPTTWDTGDWQ